MSPPDRLPPSGAFSGLRAPLFLLNYPFVALARRTAPIEYEGWAGGRGFTLTVAATSPAAGLPLHTDEDVLLVATTLLVRALDAGRPLPNPIHITPLALLRALGRPVGGAQRAQLDAALTRLVNTTVDTDLWPGWPRLFSLIERVERPAGPGGPYELHLPEILLAVVRAKHIRSFAPAALRLHGLERRLYGWARANADRSPDGWSIELRDAHQRACAPPLYADPRRRGAALRQFKAALVGIAAADRLPGYRLTLEPRGERLELVLRPKVAPATDAPAAVSAAAGADIGPAAPPVPAAQDDSDDRPWAVLD